MPFVELDPGYAQGVRDQKARFLWAYHRRHVRLHDSGMEGFFKSCYMITCRMARDLTANHRSDTMRR